MVLREGLTRWFWSREWARRQLVGENKTRVEDWFRIGVQMISDVTNSHLIPTK